LASGWHQYKRDFIVEPILILNYPANLQLF
jgi:hypothetical protein